ncbi:MAG: sigma 54-interacting transcriptional regulator [Tissierellia bacterium]|nr:sigma 54-interacting transcriptional regulator [Tissierellia bacterium]
MLTREFLYQNELFDNILDHCNSGLNVVDEEGKIVYVNKISAEYANSTVEEMIGKKIDKFYPNAMLLNVLKNEKIVLDKKIHYVGDKRYVVSSYPIYVNGEFCGAFSVFRDIREIDDLNRKIQSLELHLSLSERDYNISQVIGSEGSMKDIIIKAKRSIGSIGGPRHSIIFGESGTGKTMLANLMYSYAKEIGVLASDAPFIEVNCAQYTNPDIAALEIFGSEEGAYTGAKQRKGLLERANGGILFLDEAHALEHYQMLLLKAVESGSFRRLGGNRDISVDVIIIAASTKNLKEELLPELYQRLAQYELHLPTFKERSYLEKEELLNHFVSQYEEAVKELHNINYKVEFSDAAKKLLFRGEYPRNIRQFKDFINYSIDSAAPLISDLKGENSISTLVKVENLPFEILPMDLKYRENENINETVEDIIDRLEEEGLGARRISNSLKKMGYNIEYYQVAYYQRKKKRRDSNN